MHSKRILMHPPTSTQEARRAAILDLLRRSRISSQAELGALLAKRGLRANQATLSRDLVALGVSKGPGGYNLPDSNSLPAHDPGARLVQAARQYLLSATPVQNQVVLRTPPSAAQPLASAIDAIERSGVVGTIAGDDTILIICRDPRAAGRAAKWLLEASA
jgi:transcriptional regulator of arginine metabolism